MLFELLEGVDPIFMLGFAWRPQLQVKTGTAARLNLKVIVRFVFIDDLEVEKRQQLATPRSRPVHVDEPDVTEEEELVGPCFQKCFLA